MKSDKIILGIDLGTTYSAVAYVDEYGEGRIIPNDQGQRITPSVVYFDSEEEKIIVGQSAKDQIGYDSSKVVSFVKREMGKLKDEVTPKPYDFNGKRYAPEEISASILKKLKTDAENYFQGKTITDAIITVPAYFNDVERESTKQAGKMAGLNVLRVINEPTAAAIAYGLTNAGGQSQKVFVFDLGGGTFDVTILEVIVENDTKDVKVINTGGDHKLGGKDWDDKIIDYVSNQFIKEFGEDPRISLEGSASLREQAEGVKKTLSIKDTAKIIVRTENNKQQYSITRQQFETMTVDLMTRIEGFCTAVLQEVHLNWLAIDTILLVGGSTRMPMVKKMLEKISGKQIRTNLINPDECVAVGAAIQATITTISNGDSTFSPAVAGKLGKVKVTDILSHSLGNIAFDKNDKRKVYHILKKGTPVPCKHNALFQTRYDYQKEVLFTFTEGESENPENVVVIQDAMLAIINPLPKGAPLELAFAMSEDGTLTIIGKDVVNNQTITVSISRKGNLTADEVFNGMEHLKSLEISG